jgi:hypothetical protein
LAQSIEFSSADTFEGIIWNTLSDGYNKRLFIEVRDTRLKSVSFSALNLHNNQWLWKGIVLEEAWWISLGAVAADVLLLTLYTDSGNPDRKSLLAFHVLEKRMIWWRNGFAVSGANHQYVSGVDAKYPDKSVILDLSNGQPVDQIDFHLEVSQNFPVIRPFQYEQGTDHFRTVSDFLQLKCGVTPVVTIEYLEYESLVIASAFVQEQDLANYLYVFAQSGEILLKEMLGEDLKGVALDTFFVFSGHLIFVKNKHELISYKIV